MGRLSGRAVIITGAAQEIGAAYAGYLAAQGAKVFVFDVLDVSEAIAAIRAKGHEVDGCRCDITDANSVADLITRCKATFGSIHGLVNNAALFAALPRKPLEDAVLSTMGEQGYGKIVNIASGTVFRGVQHVLPYETSKGAIVAITRCVAREAGGYGIRVNCIAPGLTLSNGVKADEPWAKWGEATVASRAIKREQEMTDLLGTLEFLLSPDSDVITGQTLLVDGGAVMR